MGPGSGTQGASDEPRLSFTAGREGFSRYPPMGLAEGDDAQLWASRGVTVAGANSPDDLFRSRPKTILI
ncbi:hypothetical protein DLD82_04260 [Methanospirillum stamsii]|uniref:Uncharacterized protein n=1 Tax=Methanospirillum stamsii TaxID=1277351 RepID=A0A2V2N9U5_9EURY|nr:hypothetical protein DLD82_04260 [Methanospirillum stamsii]